MKTFFSLFLAVCGICAAQGTVAKAVKTTAPIKLDGQLTEEAWKTALKFDRFYINNSEEPGFPTEALVLYDDDALYIGGRAQLPAGGQLVARETRRDGRVYGDDCFEIMLDPNLTRDRYFHILVNALGTIMDRYCDQGGHVGDDKWDGDISAAAFRGEGFWSVEVRVPFYSLDINPEGSRTWGINICRDSRKPNQEASIAPNGAFNVAGSFIPIEGIDIDMAAYGWETSPTAVTCTRNGEKLAVTLATPITNLAKAEQTVKIDYTLLGEGTVTAAEQTWTFQPGEAVTVTAVDIPVERPGDYRCIVSVLHPIDRRILKRRTYPVVVAFSPFEIILTKPHYRDAIFASQKLAQVVYTVKSHLGDQAAKQAITTGIRRLDGTVLCSQTLAAPGEVQFPVAPLPEERMEIFVAAGPAGEPGNDMATHPLRKLPYQKGEVWLDEERFWRVDGERFFFLGGWNDVHVPGLNVVVGEAAAEPGGKFITGRLMWSNFPARKSYKLPNVLPEDEQIIRETVRGYRSNPDLFGYYLSDEPEITGISVAGLTHAARIIRDEDPYHPIIVSNDTINGSKDFANAAEINGLHPYPNPAKNVLKSNFSRVVAFMDQVVAFNRERRHPQTITFLQQGFNYGDHGALNSRIPTYDEIRTQYLMSIILGGRGILTYNRTTHHYPELYLGMPEFVREISFLAPILLSEDVIDPSHNVDNPNIRWMVKRYQGQLWVLAVSTTHGREQATLTIPELGDQTLQVLSEEREVNSVKGVFRDVFDNFQVHIYTTERKRPDLKSLAAIEQLIADANRARRKPGNLAFQAFEHDSLKITASSNAATSRRDDCGLWHVTDGVIIDYPLPPRRKHAVIWTDATDNVAPDWLELEFKQPQRFGRVVLYPYENTLRDYELQAWINGAWQTLAKNEAAEAKRLEHAFAPVVSNRLRLVVTATNGSNVKLDEIEVYAE